MSTKAANVKASVLHHGPHRIMKPNAALAAELQLMGVFTANINGATYASQLLPWCTAVRTGKIPQVTLDALPTV